jgi:hypothetical protein
MIIFIIVVGVVVVGAGVFSYWLDNGTSGKNSATENGDPTKAEGEE